MARYLWRICGFICFLMTFIQGVMSLDVWSSFCDMVNIECCQKSQVEYNETSFTLDLAKLHSQPFVSSIIPRFLGSHVYLTDGGMKPISFYFHGSTGTGKTFLTSLIIKNIYRHGINSKFVKFLFLGKDYFEDENKMNIEDLKSILIHKTHLCPELLFVFDGYSECWFKIIDFVHLFDDHFLNAIFIFIGSSNTEVIYQHLWNNNNNKDAIDHRKLLNDVKEKNPLLKNANLVYVPFLPMVFEDVRKCISDQLDKMNVPKTASMREEVISGIMVLIEFNFDVSNSGCKKVADKTALFLAQYNIRQEL